MRAQALLVLVVLMFCACGCSGQRGSTKQPAAKEDSTPDSTYAELIQKGERYFAAGRLAEARVAFEEAAAVDLFEIPNYTVLVRIAAVKCREGDVNGARAILKDFRCMLAVDSGRIPCFIDDRLSPDLSAECAKRMCDEMHLSYYENPTEAQLKRVEELTREANRVEQLCSGRSR